MARAAQQSVGAVTVWMIIFAALWLTSTVFLIILYTGQEELKTDTRRYQQAKDRCISAQEERSIALIQNVSDNGPTQVGILEQSRRDTALLASGDEADDASTIRAKRDKLFDEVKTARVLAARAGLDDLSLLEGATELFAVLKVDRRQVQELTDEVARLTGEINRIEELNLQQQEAFEQKTKEMEAKLTSIEGDRTTYRTERDQAVATLEESFKKRDEQNTFDITKERERNAQLEKDLSDLRGRVLAQAQKFGSMAAGPKVLATARESDGKVLMAVPGDEIVYINRGRRDRVTLGLQFAVYDAETGVPSDGRAKARIEVVNIFEESSECKIVQQRSGRIVFEGDVVANPIYDPSRAQTFLVVGDFDLNHDGRVDSNGVRLVESLVTEWGGEVTDDLNATTDFVVLGAAPRRPRPDGGRTLTAEQAERRAAMLQAWNSYESTVSTATALSVPIMSQDLFLNFLGFHSR